MLPSGPPTTLTDAIASRPGRVAGVRAVIEFSPKLVSLERLCAGVVVRTDIGEVFSKCALDKRKVEHAFGLAGTALYEIANALCQSLAKHWADAGEPSDWIPPFEGARIARAGEFTARSASDAVNQGLNVHSTLATLLSHYEIAEQARNTSIVERVKTAVKRDNNAKHLSARFNRVLPLGHDAAPLRVDFLGQNFACYFLQIVKSARHSEVNSERALGKLYELQVLRRFITKPKKSLGLLDDEKPKHFELVMVGSRTDLVQRRIMYSVEAMADKSEVRARVVDSALAAAEHVANSERLAA